MMLARTASSAADFSVSGLAQLPGFHGDFAEPFKGLRHHADFVLAAAIRYFDVELAVRHGRHPAAKLAHAAAQALRGQERYADNQQHYRNAGAGCRTQRVIVLGDDIVVVDAGADITQPQGENSVTYDVFSTGLSKPGFGHM